MNIVKKVTEVEKCPICGSGEKQSFILAKDETVSKFDFQIVKCKKCEFAFTSPRPIEEDLGKYYESDEYISHSNTSKGIISRLYQRVRKYTLGKKLKLVNRESLKGSLLDIGCGTGEF